MLDVTLIPLSGSASQDAQWECSSIDFHRPFHHCLRWSFFLILPVYPSQSPKQENGGTQCRQGLPAREAVEGGAPTGSWREATEGWNKLKGLFLGKSWI